MEKKNRILSNADCIDAGDRLAYQMRGFHPNSTILIYGVPRGGIPVAYLCAQPGSVEVVDKPTEAQIIVDDCIGTGATKNIYQNLGYPFLTLGEFLQDPKKEDEWLTFPWEVTDTGEDVSADDIVLRLLDYIGEDTKRGGLIETPKRVLKAWKAWTSGYNEDPAKVLKCFEDGAESYDQMVTVKDIPFYSQCEHHLAPFFGTATISYIPKKKVVGLSKLSRLLDIFARRLQVQERLTTQVADAIQKHLAPVGVGVQIKARHLCCESRGISKQGHHTITTALRGDFMTDPTVRAEFMATAR